MSVPTDQTDPGPWLPLSTMLPQPGQRVRLRGPLIGDCECVPVVAGLDGSPRCIYTVGPVKGFGGVVGENEWRELDT